MKKLIEGKTEFFADTAEVVNKNMEAFFNPDMKYVRDLTIALLKSWDKQQLRVALPLAGSGVRALRILKEVKKQKIAYVYCNDHDEKTFKILEKNKETFGDERMFLAKEEADEFLLYRKGFDYIDIDPYGSPNPFLDSAIKRISNYGILAITATDVKALAGSAKQAGLRKYGAYPEAGNHENGLRNLAKKVIAVGAQYDKALVPIFSVSNLHYYRIFFKVKKSKQLCNELLEKPFPLFSEEAKEIIKELKKLNSENFNELIEEEIKAQISDKNFFDIHKLCKENVISQVPKIQDLINELKKKNYKASRTHISRTAIWTDAEKIILKELIKKY